MRDFDGFVETRRRILTEKPQNKTHWMAFAVANYLAGNLGEASRIIDQYQSSVLACRERNKKNVWGGSFLPPSLLQALSKDLPLIFASFLGSTNQL